jgi:hypothetical protein
MLFLHLLFLSLMLSVVSLFHWWTMSWLELANLLRWLSWLGCAALALATAKHNCGDLEFVFVFNVFCVQKTVCSLKLHVFQNF